MQALCLLQNTVKGAGSYMSQPLLLNLQREHPIDSLTQVVDVDRLRDMQRAFWESTVDDTVRHYIVRLVQASRERGRDKAEYVRFVEYGASPRASLCLYRCTKVKALLSGRTFVIPEDVKAVAPAVLRHRILLTYEAEAESVTSDVVVAQILKGVEVP